MQYHTDMHLRFSHCMGMPVLEEGSDMVLGSISGILIEPDTGKIEGFFVGQDNFVAQGDIARWGARLYVRFASAVAPANDRIRLQQLLSDPRTVLDQKIRTESGQYIGRCSDVQFSTKSMHIEWIFPRKWFREKTAVPVSSIVEVTPQSIIIKDLRPLAPVHKEIKQTTVLPEIETPLPG